MKATISTYPSTLLSTILTQNNTGAFPPGSLDGSPKATRRLRRSPI
ncbi:hypothetical protein [Limnospira fusiformis]|nr:hypothetical protein HFV01_18960 [Limnospira fusiformis SAG 85.79]